MDAFRAALVLIVALAAETAFAQLRVADDSTMEFAGVDAAREVLTQRDDFVERMSPFDRAARLKIAKDVSTEEYLAFVGKSVLAWEAAEKERVGSAFQGVQQELLALRLPLPKQVLFIKTTGDEEGGAAYTRANAIILPRGQLTVPPLAMQKLICHELFHILSRANPALRAKLYAAIGFVPCDELAFPAALAARKITNPDAPRNDHCVRLTVRGSQEWAVPILFASAEKYDAQRGGEFFDYLQFRFLLVERAGDSSRIKPLYDGDQPRLVDVRATRGLFEQVGRNTGYVVHPEEILADNFALLVRRDSSVRSPEIIDKLRAILATRDEATPKAALPK